MSPSNRRCSCRIASAYFGPMETISNRRDSGPVTSMLDLDAIGRQAALHPIGPLDQDQAVALEILLRPEGEKLVFVAEPVGVDVIDRRGGRDTPGSRRTWG